MADIPLTVIGGRGPHGLALHLWMQERGLTGYKLVDAAPHWLPLYGPDGPMKAVGYLRSPKELDFSLGNLSRAMSHFQDDDGSSPLENVYSLNDAVNDTFNKSTTEANRAPRLAFWKYANCIAKTSGADEHVIQAKVERLEPVGQCWNVHLSNGDTFTTRAVVLATGLRPHLRIPRPWQLWWQHLPREQAHHALACDYKAEQFANKKVAVLGSSNIATWEAAIKLAQVGAKVTLLSRAVNPIEWQLPFDPQWFTENFMKTFIARDAKERLRILRKIHVPASALPGMEQRALDLGVKIYHYARVVYATPLWNSVQLQYKLTTGNKAEMFDALVAATGVSPKLRELPMLSNAAQEYKAPIVVGGPVRNRPILDERGRWKNLPPLYPMGSHALTRAGLAANTLASAVVYLPLTMPNILQDAGLV
ncbi:MAG: FAD-dependent oxidoreductase [Trueperaceae bacterium]